MIVQNPALSPCGTKHEVVFSNTAAGTQDAEEEDLSELFGDKVKDDQGGSGHDSQEVTLSDGEEPEETVKQRVLPDPGEPTACIDCPRLANRLALR